MFAGTIVGTVVRNEDARHPFKLRVVRRTPDGRELFRDAVAFDDLAKLRASKLFRGCNEVNFVDVVNSL